jgi:tetratricopeptide (TPR) repeat protein
MAAEAMKTGADRCPDLETIGAYLDRTLPESERDRIAAHISNCEACYFVFSEAVQVHVRDFNAGIDVHPAAAPAVNQGRWRVAWSSAAAGLLAASLAMMVWMEGPWGAATSSELRALVAAVGTDRTIEPRLTGGFAYGPLRGPVRSGSPTDRVGPDVRIAAARIEKQAADRTPRELSDLGVAYLVIDDVERAVPALEDAAARSKTDARLLSDLSAAYLVRAARRNQAADLTLARTAAESALRIDNRLPEALFNNAIALERLSLIGEARQAWQDYLTVDSSSGWATEARRHLESLTNSGPGR